MRTTDTSLGNLLFGQTRGRILTTLYGMPDNAFFIRQIARSIDVSVGTVQRELATLAGVGLILRTHNGNQVFYQANRDHPAFAELHALLAKTTGVFHLLTAALSPLAERIEFAFVYGSFARGDENAASDIDLMVIGEVGLDELLDHLTPLERTLGRPLNPTVYSRKELRAKLKAENHFLTAIQKGQNAFLIGDQHEFREIH